MEKLPADIMLDILSRLPHETIINFGLVRKSWRDITSNIKVGFIFQLGKHSGSKLCYGQGDEQCDDDISMHGIYSYKTLMEIDNHPSIDMVGSCNGLVCFSVKEKSSLAHDPIYLCNPVTEEYVYLPKFDNYNRDFNGKTKGYFYSGFGYHHSTDKYKVVRIYYGKYKYELNPGLLSPYESECRQGQVQVYTLGSGHGWRDIGIVSHDLNFVRGVCANGALHWIVDREKKIVAFDLADEVFRLIPFPKLSPKRSYELVCLKLMFGGYLCVVHVDAGKEDVFVHVWALEKKKKKFSSRYDMRGQDFDDFWRWSKKFSIPCTKDVTYFPFAVTKSNQVLVSSDRTISCYDLGTKALRKLCDDCPMRYSLAIPHVNSLVSLEALGEKSKKKRNCVCVESPLLKKMRRV